MTISDSASLCFMKLRMLFITNSNVSDIPNLYKENTYVSTSSYTFYTFYIHNENKKSCKETSVLCFVRNVYADCLKASHSVCRDEPANHTFLTVLYPLVCIIVYQNKRQHRPRHVLFTEEGITIYQRLCYFHRLCKACLLYTSRCV